MSNYLMLRGAVPEDRPPEEIMHNSLVQDDDMWIHLFSGLLGPDDVGRVVYYDRLNCAEGYSRQYCGKYCSNLNVLFKQGISDILWTFGENVDVIFSRGGFQWQADVMIHYGDAFKIYYGAGKRFLPKDGVRYDLILCDSMTQKIEIERVIKGADAQLFIKPAVDHMFYPRPIKKEFDVCYVCGFPEAKRKNMEWVWETCNKDIKVLQLGNTPSKTPPDNFTIRKVQRAEMAVEYSRCKVGIIPYTEGDSCPRVIPEMLACGLPIVFLDNEMFWMSKYLYSGVVVEESFFWNSVLDKLNNNIDTKGIYSYYNDNLSLPIATEFLTKLIERRMS